MGQYYETAANLGDTGMLPAFLPDQKHDQTTDRVPADAMNEVAWCYNEGFGCKKDRVCKLLIIKKWHEPKVPNSFINQLICRPMF